MPRTGLEPREHDDNEVRALPAERHPVPFEAFGYNQPALRRGQGLSRKSLTGDRWCPFCRTPLLSARQSCERCHPIRLEAVQQGLVKPDPPESPDQGFEAENLAHLMRSIDEMSRVIGVSSAHQNRSGGLSGAQVEDIFMACKDVMVAADPVRRSLTTAD